MLKVILARLQQKHRTIKYPAAPPPALPDRLRGLPAIDATKCQNNCRACVDACPVGAITKDEKIRIDLGKCLFCTDCANACPQHAITFSGDYRLSVRKRQDLLVDQEKQTLNLAAELDAKMKKIFGRSLKLRQICAGGCNACEADVNVLNTVGWDLGRFGIQFVASPRHADGLLITGPVTKNMELALKKAYNAVAAPKIVIVVGACAINGGPYINHEQVNNGAGNIVPIDLYIPGCPPHPLTILDGLLRLLGRIEKQPDIKKT
ncbi:MAG: NADH-quinone oxidoreductase subunit NuoB [Victivallaceae bacterium]